MGNLTRDPELKYLPKGTAVAELGMAINRQWTTEGGEKHEEVTFVDVELFGKTAELAEKYLKKGRPVYIEGRLKLDNWDDKQTGQKRSKMRVVGEVMQFLGDKGDSAPAGREANQEPRQHGSAPSGGYPRAPRPGAVPRPLEPGLEDLDDVPFAPM